MLTTGEEDDTGCSAVHSQSGICGCTAFVLDPNKKDGWVVACLGCGHSKQVHGNISYRTSR